jgi:hypothetical protein
MANILSMHYIILTVCIQFLSLLILVLLSKNDDNAISLLFKSSFIFIGYAFLLIGSLQYFHGEYTNQLLATALFSSITVYSIGVGNNYLKPRLKIIFKAITSILLIVILLLLIRYIYLV